MIYLRMAQHDTLDIRTHLFPDRYNNDIIFRTSTYHATHRCFTNTILATESNSKQIILYAAANAIINS